jgi:uncharacterized protein (TIGR02391 family)
MVKDYLKIVACLQKVRDAAAKAGSAYDGDDAKFNRAVELLRGKVAHLADLWPQPLEDDEVKNLSRHAHFAEKKDFTDIPNRDIPAIEKLLNGWLLDSFPGEVGFEQLLHPIVREHCLDHYRTGHYRDAVVDAMLVLTDTIRTRSGVDDDDGTELVAAAFTPVESPRLIFSTLGRKSGMSDQRGFEQIMRGAYTGIRNPKAHDLHHDLDDIKAAQYLVFISLLVRRVDEAKANRQRRTSKPKAKAKAQHVPEVQ